MVRTVEEWNGSRANGKIVISVPHVKVYKVSTRPTRVYIDEEPNTDTIGQTLAERVNARLVINDTLSDVNKPDHFFDFDEHNKNEYYNAITRSNPRLVIDLHGTMDTGPMLMKPRNDGLRYFRPMQERTVIGNRPDVDIELGRKNGYVTCKAPISVMLANILSQSGFITDFESVYPGGYIIRRVSGVQTDALAMEIARRVRSDPIKLNQLVDALALFIQGFTNGKQPAIKIDESRFVNSEALISAAIQAQQQQEQRQRGGAQMPGL